MKRLFAIFIMVGLLVTLYGCGKSADETVRDVNITADNADDLKTSSEKLALQMVERNFKDTHQKLSPLVKLQLSKESLQEAWDKTVEGMGKYIEVYEITQEATDKYQIVIVILRYENNGLKISFTYNKKNALDGLWFNYAYIEEEPVTSESYEEIEITLGDKAYPLTGILTLPKNVEHPPVAILVPGSGNHGLNEAVGSNKPFQDIAWGLAEEGVATIRYNEKLFLYPELAQEGLTIEMDSLDDAAAAISYAKNCEQINKDQIYIIGHSLGGMMAPKIAADHEEIVGLIILAGSPRSLADIIYDQVMDAVKNTEGVSEEQAEEAIASTLDGMEKVRNLTEVGDQILLGFPATYWYSLNQIHIAKLAPKLSIPMFIAQGSADFQVSADKDFAEWQELLGNQENVTFKLYDNLNHLFMATNGKRDITEYNIKGSVDKALLHDMVQWIKER